MEPTNELFAAVHSIRAARIAEEEAQAQQVAEAAASQFLIDQQQSEARQQSEQRAVAFADIMDSNNIPFSDFSKQYRNIQGPVLEGWVIRYAESKVYINKGETFYESAAVQGCIILRDGIITKFSVSREDSQTYLENNGRMNEPIFAGEKGLQALGKILEEHGIAN